MRHLVVVMLLLSSRLAAAQKGVAGLDIVPQVGHADMVGKLVFSPDGRLVASAGTVVKLWDVETGMLLRTLEPRGNEVQALAFLSDGRELLTATMTEVQIWSLAGMGREVAAWELPRSSGDRPRLSHAIALSPDGAVLALDYPTALYDARTGAKVRELDDLYDAEEFAFSANGTVAAFNAGDLGLWEVATGKRLRSWTGFQTGPLAISADGSKLCAPRQGDDGVIAILDTKREGAVDLSGGSILACGGLSPDGRSVAIAGGPPRLARTDGSGGSVAMAVRGPAFATLSADGHRIATLEMDQVIRVWDDAGRPLQVFSGHQQEVNALAFTADGRYLVAAGLGPDVAVWDLTTLGLWRTLEGAGSAAAVAIAGGNVITAGRNGSLRVWDLAGARLLSSRMLPGIAGRPMSLSADGSVLISGGADGTATRWDVASGKPASVYPAAPADRRSHPIERVLASADGRLIVAEEPAFKEEPPSTVRIWTADGRLIRGDIPALGPMALAADGNRLLIGDGQTRWGFFSEKECGNSTLVTVDRNGKPTGGGMEWPHACAGADQVRLWDLRGGSRGLDLDERAAVTAVAFAGDGKRAASARERDVTVWDTETDAALRRLRSSSSVVALAFSPDGHLLAAGDREGLRLWNLDSGAGVLMMAAAGEWLVTDADGFFDASRRGGDLVGAIQFPAAYRIDQLAALHNRPDLLLERMGLGSAEVREHYRARHQRRLRQLGLDDAGLMASFERLPRVAIVDARAQGKRAEIRFEITSSFPLKSYSIWVDDVPLFGPLGKPISGTQQQLREVIDLTSGRNRIEISALDSAGGEAFRVYRDLPYASPTAGAIYYLGFGVSRHRDSRLNLAYAHKDAFDLERYFRALARPGRPVYTLTLTDEQVTRAGIARARSWLARAGVDDLVVLFVAGHGTHTDDAVAEYYYVTHDTDVTRLRQTAASFETVEGLLQGTAARRKLFLMDTCESGELDERAEAPAAPGRGARGIRARTTRAFHLRRAAGPPRTYLSDRERFIETEMARRTGAIVFSSSRGNEYSFELDSLQNGAFTSAILQALGGAADRDGDGTVTTDELRRRVRETVATMTADRQHPTVDRDNPAIRFGLPVLRGPLPQPHAERPRGCGCRSSAAGADAVLLLVLLVLLGRRRR